MLILLGDPKWGPI